MNAIERLWEGVKALFEAERAGEEPPENEEPATRLLTPEQDIAFRECFGRGDSVGALRVILNDPQAEFTVGDLPERAIAMPAMYEMVIGQLMARDEQAWLNDLYEDNGQLVAIASIGGKLYRASVVLDGAAVVLGELVEVETQFAPVRNSLTVRRQADGRYRWFALAETAVLNRCGEIDSRDLFDSFVANAAEHGYPELRFFHDSRLRLGQADYVAREGHCYLASGLLDVDNPLAIAFADAVERGRGVWGNSVGFLAVEPSRMVEIAPGVTVPVYRAGINREISVLPENMAASWFTTVDLEVTRMRTEVANALKILFGDEQAAERFIAVVDQTNREITERELITRDAERKLAEPAAEVKRIDAIDWPKPADAGQPAPEPKPEQKRETLDDAAIDAIVAKVLAGLPKPATVDLSPLTSAIEGLEGRVAGLETTDDEKRTRWQTDMPARQKPDGVTYRPRVAAGDGALTLAQRAEATLANMPKLPVKQ